MTPTRIVGEPESLRRAGSSLEATAREIEYVAAAVETLPNLGLVSDVVGALSIFGEEGLPNMAADLRRKVTGLREHSVDISRRATLLEAAGAWGIRATQIPPISDPEFEGASKEAEQRKRREKFGNQWNKIPPNWEKRRDAAIAWAISIMKGKDRGVGYSGLCSTFVQNAYGTGGLGLDANDLQRTLEPLEKKMPPPKGALVFIEYPDSQDDGYGHVGISMGDGTIINTTGMNGEPVLIQQLKAKGGDYQGWAYPPPGWKGR